MKFLKNITMFIIMLMLFSVSAFAYDGTITTGTLYADTIQSQISCNNITGSDQTLCNVSNYNVSKANYWDLLNTPTDITSLGTISSATSITSTTFVGPLTGNADTATNSNAWITLTSLQSKWFADLTNILTFDETELNSTIDARSINNAVTSISTTGPISGGPITSTGTISLDTATPSNGDTTHASTADQIYDWVIGLGYSTTVGTVTTVTGTSPILSSGGATPAISATIAKDLVTTAPLTGSVDNIFLGVDSDITIAIPLATTSTDGYLSQTDWDTFNSKSDTDTTYSTLSEFTDDIGFFYTEINLTSRLDNNYLGINDKANNSLLFNGKSLGVWGSAICYASGDTLNCNGGSTSKWQTFSTPSGTNPVADLVGDTLSFIEGTGITITGDSGTDSITIASTTYTALAPLGLSGTEFNITAGGIGDTQISDSYINQTLTTTSTPTFASTTITNDINIGGDIDLGDGQEISSNSTCVIIIGATSTFNIC